MSDWAGQRARFNHDKLQNQFLQSIVRLVRALEGRTLDQEFVDDFIRRLPSTWAELETEALELLDRAEAETGPSAWFSAYPLSRLSSEDRSWMEELLTREWHAHSDMQAVVDYAREALKEVGKQCRKLEEAFQLSYRLKGETMTAKKCRKRNAPNRELLDCTLALHQSCQHLIKAFHALSPDDPIRALANLDQRRCA